MRLDPEPARQFLEVLYSSYFSQANGPAYLEVRGKREGEELKFRRFYRTPADLVKDMRTWPLEQNYWSGVALRKDNRGGTKENCKVLTAAFADVDVGTAGHKGIAKYQTKEAALAAIKASPLRPSILNDSGGGYQPHWLLKEPLALTDGNLARMEHINRGLALAMGGDVGATDASRILRLPGTFNMKLAGNPRPVKIVWCEPERVYDLADFAEYEAQGKAQAQAPGEAGKPGNGDYEAYAQKALADELAKLARTPAHDPGRNNQLNKSAKALGELVGAGVLDRGQVEVALHSVAVSIGLGEVETRSTIKSGLEAGMRVPRQLPEKEAGAKSGAKRKNGPQAPKLPKIIITKKFLHQKSNEAIRILETANHPPFLFRRSGSLARISLDEKDHPRIEAINDNQLRGILARCAYFLKETEKRMVPTAPPMDLVKDILALGEWGFPPLEGIIQAPALRLDGTVLNVPGYDPVTRLFYINPPDLFVPAIPKNPPQEAVKESLGYLLEIICDFPFVDDSDRANALGLIFTLPLRPAIPGNIPMAAITSPVPGTGKSLLQEIVALNGTGKNAPMAGFPREDDEMRKFITSRLLAGDPLISFDNLELPLWGPSLSRALTCIEWEDRIMGGNTTARLPQRAVWVCNGNNLKLRGDLPRRTFPIRLDARLAKPWERENFKHKNLCEWVLRYRGDFLAAILTLGRAWFVAGKPEPKKPIPVMGGFEAWAKIIGGVLAFAGVEGFLENLAQFHDEADLEGPEWEAFLNAWVEAIGESTKTCQEVAAILAVNSGFASTLPDNLQDVLKDPEKSFERSLGRALARKENRPYGEKNLALQRVGTEKRAVLWKVAPLKIG